MAPGFPSLFPKPTVFLFQLTLSPMVPFFYTHSTLCPLLQEFSSFNGAARFHIDVLPLPPIILQYKLTFIITPHSLSISLLPCSPAPFFCSSQSRTFFSIRGSFG